MPLSIPEAVERDLRVANIPIVGVTFGSETDKSTWAVQFDPAATPAQRNLAATILAQFNIIDYLKIVEIANPTARPDYSTATVIRWCAHRFNLSEDEAYEELAEFV